jgi:hypothetical protein
MSYILAALTGALIGVASMFYPAEEPQEPQKTEQQTIPREN